MRRRPTANGGPSTPATGLPTPATESLNPSHRAGLSRNYEVERSSYYEVDATACAATRSPNGGAPRFGDAPEKKPAPIPINNEFIGNYITTTPPWHEWIEGEEDLRGEPVPAQRPEGSELADRVAKNYWDELRNGWEARHAEVSQAIQACPYGCGQSALRGTFTHTDGTLWWCHHEAAWTEQVIHFLWAAEEGGYRLPAAQEAEIEALKRAEAEAWLAAENAWRSAAWEWRNAEYTWQGEVAAELIDDVYEAVLAVHGAAAAAYAADLVRPDARECLTFDRGSVLEGAVEAAGQWTAETEAAAAAAAAEAAEEAELAAHDLEREINCTQCGEHGRKFPDSFLRAADNSYLIAVFPSGRAPHPGYGDTIAMFKSTIGHPDNPVGLVEYAQFYCGHDPSNNAFEIEWMQTEFGARITSLAAFGDASNGVRGMLPSHTENGALSGYMSPPPAIDAGDVIDAELEDAPGQTAVDRRSLSVSQESSGSPSGIAEIDER